MEMCFAKDYRRAVAFAFAIAILCDSRCAGTDLGSPAPPLQVARWIKGGPVDIMHDPGKTRYVLVFWDSNCSACQTAVPDLISLQDRFQAQNVALVCLSREPAEGIQKFLQGEADRVNFAVASDDNGRTYQAYMGAFGKSSEPYAFVIDRQGLIVWHGHPLAGLEKALQELLAGKFDIETVKRAANAENLQAEYFTLVNTSDTNLASKAIGLGNRILSEGSSNPWLLNNFAYKILADPQLRNRDLGLALKAVKAALDNTDGKNPGFLDTYARALFDTGKISDAIEAQKQAIVLCPDKIRRRGYEETLKSYQQRIKQ